MIVNNVMMIFTRPQTNYRTGWLHVQVTSHFLGKGIKVKGLQRQPNSTNTYLELLIRANFYSALQVGKMQM